MEEQQATQSESSTGAETGAGAPDIQAMFAPAFSPGEGTGDAEANTGATSTPAPETISKLVSRDAATTTGATSTPAPETISKLVSRDAATDTPDPWQAAAEQAKVAAEAAGYKTPDEWRDAQIAARDNQTAEEKWEGATGETIAAALTRQLEAGEITREQAARLYDAELTMARASRAQANQSVDLDRREARAAFETAAKAHPLLTAGGDFGAGLVEAISLSGLATHAEIIPRLAEYTSAIASQAVADYVAKKAIDDKTPTPLSPGSQAPANAPDETEGGSGDWTKDLFRRSFGRR